MYVSKIFCIKLWKCEIINQSNRASGMEMDKVGEWLLLFNFIETTPLQISVGEVT